MYYSDSSLALPVTSSFLSTPASSCSPTIFVVLHSLDIITHPQPTRIKSQAEATTPPNKQLTMTNFLDLPAELRNEIYKHFAASEGILYIGPKPDKHWSQHPFISPSALIATNKQVLKEFTPVLFDYGCLPTTMLATRVEDFNFDHLYHFINNCTADQLTHGIHVELQISKADKRVESRLHTWLNSMRGRRNPVVHYKFTCVVSGNAANEVWFWLRMNSDLTSPRPDRDTEGMQGAIADWQLDEAKIKKAARRAEQRFRDAIS